MKERLIKTNYTPHKHRRTQIIRIVYFRRTSAQTNSSNIALCLRNTIYLLKQHIWLQSPDLFIDRIWKKKDMGLLFSQRL